MKFKAVFIENNITVNQDFTSFIDAKQCILTIGKGLIYTYRSKTDCFISYEL